MSKWKYAKSLGDHDDCPPKSLRKVNMAAYRFVGNPIAEGHFLPTAHVPGARQPGDVLRCTDYSLSMFNDKAKALAALTRLLTKYRQIANRMGSWIGKLHIREDDGEASKPSRSGHFEFFEYEGCNLQSRTKLAQEVIVADDDGDEA